MEEEDDFRTPNIVIDLANRREMHRMLYAKLGNRFPRKSAALLCVHLDLQKISPKESLQSTIYFGI